MNETEKTMFGYGVVTDIEIGVSVIPRLYLHCIGMELPTPFNVSSIEGIEEGEMGTIIRYKDAVYGNPPYSDKTCITPYYVTEKKEDIEKAIEKAEQYRSAAIETINSLLK